MQTFDDYRTHKLRDRIGGRWFTENRTILKVIIETIGRAQAMTMRVLLRKTIGVETFSFWMVFWGFVWIRLCVALNAAYHNDEIGFFDNLICVFAFDDAGTSSLHLFSGFFLLAVIWYIATTEFPSDNAPYPNVLSRGESVALKPIIKDDRWFFEKEGFTQAVTAPVIGMILGIILWNFKQFYGVGIYFFWSSKALMIDEINYHRACIRKDRINKSKKQNAKKKHSRSKKRHSSEFDDYYN